jgi:hypothetical protein
MAMTGSHRTAALLICLVALLGARRSASAQTEGLELSGTVTDQLGAAIPGATVSLSDPARYIRTTTTDANGVYTFRDLPSASYDIAVSFPGFATRTASVTLKGSPRLVHDVTLRVKVEERIEVVATLDDFRRVTGVTPVGMTLGAEQLRALPNDPDTMLQVLREMSATTGTADEVSIYVDGQLLSSRLPPKGAIQSIRITTNSFAPEFAESSAGVVEIITNPAFEDFRGEAEGTFNDSKLAARNYFEPEKTPSHSQGYSGYLGGPLVLGYASFLGYAGHWARDERVPINTTIIDPVTLVPRQFTQSVAVPSRVNNFSLRADGAFAKQIVSLELGRSDETRSNYGLDSGKDLPERAFDQDTRDTTARGAWLSTFGSHVTGETRVRWHRRMLQESALSSAPAVLVLDTFNSGGNQAELGEDRSTDETSLSQILSYQNERHTIRGGFLADLTSLSERRVTNTGGTFVFGAVVNANGQIVATPLDRYQRVLQGVPGYRPSSFSISRGQSDVSLTDWQASWFLQDDIRLSRGVTFSAGVRHDVQKQGGWFDLAPRAGVAWLPGGSARHTIRASAGLFYTRIPVEIALDPLRYDGNSVRDYVVDNPPFFNTIPPGVVLTASLPTVRVATAIDVPVTRAITTSYEFEATKTIFVSVGYTYRHGERWLRTVNINAPGETGGRPQPELGPVLQFESSGQRTSHHLRFTVRRILTRVSMFATYVLGSAMSDTDGPYTVAASRQLDQEFGRAGDDERHRFVGGTVLSLPHDFGVSALLTASTGRPFNITTGFDNDGDLLFVDRPGVVTAGSQNVIETEWGSFDLNRRPGQPMIPRNTGAGPSQLVLHAGVAKVMFLRENGATTRTGPYVVLSASIENLTNRVNFFEFNGVATSPLFGVANRAGNPFRLELSARVGF